MRILLTNNTLSHRAGSEMYLRDLAIELAQRGHRPIAYSPVLGQVSDELRAASVPVIADLDQLTEPPDVIHAQHHLETMAALLRFRDTPAVYVCHGWTPWEESIPWHPRIRRYVAVSELLSERLISSGIPASRVEVLGNAVDLGRFRSRDSSLPPVPERGLVYSNSASVEELGPLRRACLALGISLDVVGLTAGTATVEPECLLVNYDVVFAAGRSALEALAVGSAVVVCSQNRLAGMVTTKDLERMRRFNFGLRLLQRPLTEEAVREEVARYDRADAALVSETVRATAGLDRLVDRLEELYRTALDDHRSGDGDVLAEARAESRYVQWLKDVLAGQESLYHQIQSTDAALHKLTHERSDLARELHETVVARDEARQRNAGLERESEILSNENERLSAENEQLTSQLAAEHGTVTWRLRERLLGAPKIVRIPLGRTLRMMLRSHRTEQRSS